MHYIPDNNKVKVLYLR